MSQKRPQHHIIYDAFGVSFSLLYFTATHLSGWLIVITRLYALLFIVVVVDVTACEYELFNHSVLPCYYYYYYLLLICSVFRNYGIFFVFFGFLFIFSRSFSGTNIDVPRHVHEKMHEVWNGRRETCYQSVDVRCSATRWRSMNDSHQS